MPLTGDTYTQRTQDEILAFLEAELRAEYGNDIDLTESSAFRTFAQALSTVDAEELEPALQQVHEAGFLDTAEGENLDKVVAILGITRRAAVHATGTIQFSHGSTVGQNYTVDNGAIVQTDGSDPVQFETTERVELSWFDDFESGALRSAYGGQTGSFGVVDGSASGDPTPTEGNGELRAAASSGDKVFIGGTSATSVGCTIDFRNYLQDSDSTPNAAAGNLFGVVDSSNFYRIRLDSGGEHAIEVATTGGGTQSLASNAFSVPENEWLRNEVTWSPENSGTITSRLYDSSGTIVDEVSVTGEDTIEEGGFGFEQLGGTENVYWDHSGEQSVLADARSRLGGTVGNIASNTLTVMPSVPTGVQAATNPYPMGDDDHYLTSLLPFDAGQPRESDEELRERASVSEGARGNATVPALIAAATELPEAESVSVYENKTNTDNTGSGGLPPKSFELVYYGNDSGEAIAEMLHSTRAFTSRDHGGAHGTGQNQDVTAINGQTFNYEWSEPTELSIDMTLDVVVNEEFIGEDALRDRIVNYVGGTRADGTNVLGTGEDVYVDQIEDVVTGPDDTGVIGIGSYSFTPSVTSDANGLEVVAVGSNEVASTNAEDASITLNITRV